jgi:lipoprotein NlpI
MSIKACVFAGAIALMAVTGFAGSAAAQQSQAWTWCENKEKASPDIQIGGCTTVIQSGKESKKNLATAFNNRGNAYDDKKQYDRAIQDYDQAIKLNPNYALAFLNRGNAYQNKDQYDRAIQDYDQAIKLNPNYALAFYNRGLAYDDKKQYDRAIQDYDQAIQDFDQAIKLDPNDAIAFYNRGNAYRNKGQYDRAIQDFDQAIKLDPNHANAFLNRGYTNFYTANYGAAASGLARSVTQKPDHAYPVLWLYLARARSGSQNAVKELEANAEKLKRAEWPYAVVELYLGRRTAEATLAAAGKPDERCEAQFYVGIWHLLRSDRAAATELLKAAVDTCPKTFIEYAGAQAEVKRLGL